MIWAGILKPIYWMWSAESADQDDIQTFVNLLGHMVRDNHQEAVWVSIMHHSSFIGLPELNTIVRFLHENRSNFSHLCHVSAIGGGRLGRLPLHFINGLADLPDTYQQLVVDSAMSAVDVASDLTGVAKRELVKDIINTVPRKFLWELQAFKK